MADDYLYAQLFNDPSPKKKDQNESNVDIMSSLFSVQLPTSKPTPAEIKKKKSEEEISQYISRMSAKNNAKSKQDLERLK